MFWSAAIASLLLGAVAPASSRAQIAGVADSALTRVARLADAGLTDQARAAADSVLDTLDPGEPIYAEGLYWKAHLASSSAAEPLYRRIVVEYAASARLDDALFALAVLDSSRGNTQGALDELDEMFRRRPDSELRVDASVLAAHLLRSAGNLQGACAALDSAVAYLSPNAVERHRQLDYEARECASVAASAKPPAAQKDLSAVPAAGRFAIQVAAYATKPAASALSERLHGRGFPAVVIGDKAPYRVWMGDYATRVAAQQGLAEAKRTGLVTDGFVVRAGAK